jgi:hypothetical protein
MAHQFTISDDIYATIAMLAKERGQSPEEFVVQLLQQQVESEWEAACVQYDTITASPNWQQMEAEAESQMATGLGDFYNSDDALIKAFEQHR